VVVLVVVVVPDPAVAGFGGELEDFGVEEPHPAIAITAAIRATSAPRRSGLEA
jgi:hypothetical protein